MRITHLILTRHFAGSERHAVELANAQAREHDVSLVLRRGAAGGHADAFADRVDPKVHTVLVPDWLPVWHAANAVKRLRPDVAHAHLSGACRALQGLQGVCLRVATLHIHYKASQHAALDALVAVAPSPEKSFSDPAFTPAFSRARSAPESSGMALTLADVLVLRLAVEEDSCVASTFS